MNHYHDNSHEDTYDIGDLVEYFLINTEEFYALKESAIINFIKQGHRLNEKEAAFLYAYGPKKLFHYTFGTHNPYVITLYEQEVRQWLTFHNEKHPGRSAKTAIESVKTKPFHIPNEKVIHDILRVLNKKGITVTPQFNSAWPGLHFNIPEANTNIHIGRLLQFIRLGGGTFNTLYEYYPKLNSNTPEPIEKFLRETFAELDGVQYKLDGA